jgi:hypothetical protein
VYVCCTCSVILACVCVCVYVCTIYIYIYLLISKNLLMQYSVILFHTLTRYFIRVPIEEKNLSLNLVV